MILTCLVFVIIQLLLLQYICGTMTVYVAYCSTCLYVVCECSYVTMYEHTQKIYIVCHNDAISPCLLSFSLCACSLSSSYSSNSSLNLPFSPVLILPSILFLCLSVALNRRKCVFFNCTFIYILFLWINFTVVVFCCTFGIICLFITLPWIYFRLMYTNTRMHRE